MSYPRIHSFKPAGIVLAVFIYSLCASGQVLRGTIVDGTTKKPAAGDDVILLKLDRAMTEEKRTKSNARGEFSFELPDSKTMRVVRVVHQKVSYHEPVAPGSTSVTVTVYEVEPALPGIHRTDQSVIFQAQGGTLQVVELFNIHNESQPPRTQPTFSFYLPDGAKIESGEAMRENAMPLKSAPVPQEEKGKYLFMYPLIPGTTHFEVVYTLPYTGTLKYQPKFAGPVDKFYVVMPKSIGFSPESSSQYQATPDMPIGSGFKDVAVHVVNKPAGQEAQLGFSIAGNGMLQEDASQQGAGGSEAALGGQPGGTRRGEPEGPGGGMGVPNERPNPLSQGQWVFLGVLMLFLAGGAAFVYMTSPSGNVAVAGAGPHGSHGSSAPLLEALKEEMFQLEADRVQGKLNHQDYQSAKSALDKTLQRAMKKKATV